METAFCFLPKLEILKVLSNIFFVLEVVVVVVVYIEW